MPTPKSPFDGQNDPPSLGDRTLDRWIGLDKLDVPAIELPPRLSGNPGKAWDSSRHRESTVWGRTLRAWHTRAAPPGFWSSEPGADPANHWSEFVVDLVGWSAIAAVVVALLYLVWYGLAFFQIL
jgi:hypothetical protein